MLDFIANRDTGDETPITDISLPEGFDPFYVKKCSCCGRRILPHRSYSLHFVDESHVGRWVDQKREEYAP